MSFRAGLDKEHIQSNDMIYKKATADDLTREYDSCYYEITADVSVLDQYVPKKIHMQISSKVNINVFIYSGRDRFEATESVILGNEQGSIGQTYSVTADKGFLVVAYPNDNSPSEFGFNYWLEAELIQEEPVTDENTTPAVVVPEPVESHDYVDEFIEEVPVVVEPSVVAVTNIESSTTQKAIATTQS